MSEILSGIYKIYCENTKKYYIGQSVNVINRLKQHLKELKNNKHINKELQTDFNNYGEDAFIFEKIKDVEEEFLNIFEKYYMEYYNSLEDGYNVIPMNNLIRDKYKNINNIDILKNIEPIRVRLRAADMYVNQLIQEIRCFTDDEEERPMQGISDSISEVVNEISELEFEILDDFETLVNYEVELAVRRRFNKLGIEEVGFFEVDDIYRLKKEKIFNAYVRIGKQYVEIDMKCMW